MLENEAINNAQQDDQLQEMNSHFAILTETLKFSHALNCNNDDIESASTTL